jgi:hypothetical protein
MKYISHKGLQSVYEIFFPPDLYAYTSGSVATATARTETTAHYVRTTATG